MRSLPRASAFHRFPLPLTAVRQLQHFSKKTPWTSTVEEIFDVQVLPGVRFPEVIGFQQETIQHTFIVPKS